MYTDPWDLKHSIQLIEQQERQNKNLLAGQKNSSSTYSDKDNIKSNPEYDFSQSNFQEDTNSDQHATQHSNDLPQNNGKFYTQANDIQFVQKPLNLKPRKKYGNMVVFLQTKSFILSLGPNYLFFFFAYVCFTIASVYLVYLVNTSVQNFTFKVCNFAFCALQNLSYLLVAFSNPGVKLPQNNLMMSNSKDQTRLCKACGAVQQRKTYHCRECDICISDYDHHCPWTSKCIGGGNLKRFYLFVGVTPFYIFYYVVAFMICMASLTVPHANSLKSSNS